MKPQALHLLKIKLLLSRKNKVVPSLGVRHFLSMLLVCLGLSWLSGCASESTADKLVVYCAHDSVYSEKILKKFEQESGIDVEIRFDTEATKSLGLIQLIKQEQQHPRCDVFWNNEVLGIMELHEAGLLEPYNSPSAERIPDQFKNADGYWTGFAARLRVFIVNTEQMDATEESLQQAMQKDLSRMAIAKPLYGTTLTHYTLLWSLMGGEKLKQWHHENTDKGWKIVQGNSMVKNLVANGVCDFGWTDTDDFYLAVDAQKPVACLPIRDSQGKTICIPNTVAMIKGTDQKLKAQKLIDFLLSEKIELELANSSSRQIPLGPVPDEALSSDVRQLKEWAEQGSDLNQLLPARQECLEWLREVFLQ